MSHFLGIDVSTTATKALLIDEAGRVAAVASAPHDLSTPRPLWSEQDPAAWWEATGLATAQALAAAGLTGDAVQAVGLTGQMHGLVLLDAAGRVLRPAILWNDGRASAECDDIRARLGLDRLVALTGNDAFPGFTAPKLLWVRRHEPDVYRRVAQVLLPKDYVRFRLTGGYATDRAGAGGTLLLDLQRRDWSDEVLAALEIPRAWLPPTHEGPEVTGTVTPEAAAVTGLRAGTPVVAGGGDQAAQAVGVGAVAPGILALTLGTSGVVFAPATRPLTDPRGRAHAFPHAVPGRWHLMGVMLSAAGSLRWYHDTFAPELDYDVLLAEAAGVPPGCEGAAFLPYLSGERTPHANPFARGVFFGFTLRHGRGHATRAVLEGVAFGLRDNLRLLGEAGVPPPAEVRLSGGGARSPLWRQILADVLGLPLTAPQTTEGAAYGAALLAAAGTGAWPDVDAACAATLTCTPVAEPHPEAVERYEAAYDTFRRLYPALEPLFTAGREQPAEPARDTAAPG
ncbi:xylulokinase [Rhodocaloribacter litoris]|uniref:xylulokinase n=1 Tax=Rhodocaloribacter litoris TaxID=2558931 RepID=UPI001E313CAA|nr:xylulokinase [Rhodocaloribacter litoris]QXD14808.1 xylulokinase [Rhodocaloribacter litoris]